MQKKKIILLSILVLVTLGIVALLFPKPKKISPMQMTATEEYSTQIGEIEYDITNAVMQPSEIIPNFSAGMIPVKYVNGCWTITTRDDANWYDYTNGQPAYMMLNDGYYKSELERGIEEKQLANNNIGVGVPDDPNLDIHTRNNIYVGTTFCSKRARRNYIHKTRM